jgi:hypothetical protein
MVKLSTARHDELANDAVCLGRCQPGEKLVVQTCNSTYELIVLRGDKGEVLVRGGQKFPTFRGVRFAGSTAGGSALKLNTIDIGLRMEFHTGDSVVVTSPVVAVSRQDCAAPSHAA